MCTWVRASRKRVIIVHAAHVLDNFQLYNIVPWACEDIRCFGNYLINHTLGKTLVTIVKLGKNSDDIENGTRNNND